MKTRVVVALLLLLSARIIAHFALLSLQGSLFLVYRGETSLEKTSYFQRIYKKKLSKTPIFRPFLPILTYFYL